MFLLILCIFWIIGYEQAFWLHSCFSPFNSAFIVDLVRSLPTYDELSHEKKIKKNFKKWNWGDLLLKIGKQTFVYLFMLALEKTCSKFNTDSEYIYFWQENISWHWNIHEKRRTSICLCKYLHINHCRSSRSQMFFKPDALKNFAIFKGKHLCWSLFLI